MTTPTPRSSTSPKADRSIYFYRLDGGADDSGNPRKVDLRPALKYVNELPFKVGTGRYLLHSDGSLNCVWASDIESSIMKVQFGTIRRNALPQAESFGELKNLQLAEEEGLCEVCHLCIFPDGIVGAEYNFYGPRAPRLATYITKIAPDYTVDFKLEALMRRDVAEQLLRKVAVRALELKVRRSYIEVIKQVDGRIGTAFESAAQGSDADTIGVILGPEPYKRINLADGMLTFVRRMIGRDDLRENVQRFKADLVDENSDKADEINLLQDQLISKKKILKLNERSRVLNATDAFGRIEEAFSELRQDLLSAPSATLSRTLPDRE